jgi:hypothetical protein
MHKHRILAALVILVAVPAVAVAATVSAQPQAATAAAISAPASPPPSLDAFLASLKDPASGPAAKTLSGCGPNYCTQAQRDACNQQCLRHHHGPFVGLECCSDCTTLCNCGSVPTGC